MIKAGWRGTLRESSSVRGIAATLALSVFASIHPSHAQSETPGTTPPSGALGAWQNPNLGVVADMVVDAHDAAGPGTWRTEGFRMRAVELEFSANIDPYASAVANVYVSPEGAELHEMYALFPYLPGGLHAKAGMMLPNFGRWSQFHPHFMPFASEPRIFHEYAGGGLLLTGAELSWLAPLNRYLEISGGVYNRIAGHSHDPDPFREGSFDPLTPEGIAAEENCVAHGDHWDCPDGGVYYEEDLLALRGLDGLNPRNRFANARLSDLAFGARAKTSFEFGLDWSLDAGVSGLYQHGHKRSQRIDDLSYAKGLYGADLTFFWHPLHHGGERGADFGIEVLVNQEGFERVLSSTTIREEYETRAGAFAHARWRHNARWHFGGFGEAFQARDGESFLKRRGGVFATWNITHFQYLRLEASRYERMTRDADPVHRILLQYDAVIGYHTHGAQR